MSKRTQSDDRLDRLYMKGLRCPYCHTKIAKGAAHCPNCGITKEQIYHANVVLKNNQRSVKAPKPAVIMSPVRPASIPFWQMALGGMFGFLGIHCFIAKRYWRGIAILACTILYFVLSMIFNPAYELNGEMIEAHWFRQMFESRTFIFPSDLLSLVAIVLWVWDWVCILLGKFKYPVVIDNDD